ncbi:RNA 2',3'-cyclic phosphodiesterase [Pseudomaricurvus alcaniphilus]|uniref:RNA 2',3'-cyclic phosphodiesterase n=1 Tax=Pseudomaricurvus alcaniphilus TaxID=1166482 RepID=UPI001409374C|nr:RNA 2',3'-cyclic phosphodiesterase [Pseudomaricurvus alcaniphilus]NHN38463.1 RNA 2',3'-cyclic phosphodiesterase [Pseudomaricurvus alcaniphilus]
MDLSRDHDSATASLQQRLFTAIPLPQTVQQQLLPLAPSPQRKVRPVGAAQMHLTLSFIGQARVDEVDQLLRAALRQCQLPQPFELQANRLGKFGSNRRGTLLWAGLAEQPALLQLQAQLATALQPCLKSERRPYRPHITLARCKPHVAAAVLENFLQQPVPTDLRFTADSFGLYSSVTASGGSIYHCEHSYPLGQPLC